jgi:alkaline phosphatase
VAGADYGFVLGWATTGHTSAPVPVSASGPGAERFAGSIENIDLFHAMADAMKLSEVTSDRRRS